MTPQQETRYWKLQHSLDEINAAIEFLTAYHQYNYCPDYYERINILTTAQELTQQKQLDLFNKQINTTT